MRIIVTGGAGFIGAHLVETLINKHGHEVCTIDKLTYASRIETLNNVISNEKHSFFRTDIANTNTLSIMQIFQKFKPEAVFHLAAESHVDRSINNSEAFIKTNVLGSYHLLEVAMEYWNTLSDKDKDNFKFINVSTDEVYGSLGPNDAPFTEESPYKPNSPYSSSKASFDLILRSYYHTYNFPAITTHCSNNYGTFQYPEKLIPVSILNLIRQREVPIYGDGEQVRDWIHVDDHIGALITVLEKGKLGENYCIGASNEISNIALVEKICTVLDTIYTNHKPHKQYIKHVDDRPGHDTRYAIDNSKIKNDLGWSPQSDFNKTLSLTILWYTRNPTYFRKLHGK